MSQPTMIEIREAAQRLAAAHRLSIACASSLSHDLNEAITPIYKRHVGALDAAAAEEAEARAELQQLIDAAPQLFQRPRSIQIDGVKCGFRKDADGLDFDDEDAVIKRIRALPDLADMSAVLVRTVDALNINALDSLDGNQLRRIGVRRVSGIDQSFISFVDSEVDKLTKSLASDAAKRQGEEEAPKKAKVAKRKGAA